MNIDFFLGGGGGFDIKGLCFLECVSVYKLSISLTVGTSRLMEAQMDLPCLLFGAGFHINIVNSV